MPQALPASRGASQSLASPGVVQETADPSTPLFGG